MKLLVVWIGLLALIVFVFVIRHAVELQSQCEQSGGLVISTHRGDLCIDRAAIKKTRGEL